MSLNSIIGYTNTRCLVAAVELQIADLLAKHGPLGIVELAAKAKAQPDRLRQILRPLYNNGIFTYRPDSGTYTNNHVSKLLLRDHWTQWHNWVDLYGNEYYDIARGIPGSVREGVERSGAQVNFDTDDDMFTYFNKQGWMPRLHRTLGGGAVAMSPGILEDYPWTEVAHKTVIDVGGGGGGFITSLLSRFPTMKGGIYDLEHVIKHARDLFSPDGQYAEFEAQVPRDKLIPGDFLEWAPPSEVYTIKWVLHDWNDEDSVTILRNIRKAIINNGPASRLIVLESILCDGRMGRLSRYGDINMMMTAKGQERTEAQWRSLAKQSGWKVNQIFPLRNAWVHAIELRP